jgi:hypothetical protein
MVSQQERTKLMEAYKCEPTAGAELMLRYAIGLLFVVGLAFIGPASTFLIAHAAQ